MENYYYDYYAKPSPGATFLSLAFAVLAIVAMWKIFEKAGKPGWAAIIPFYNIYGGSSPLGRSFFGSISYRF